MVSEEEIKRLALLLWEVEGRSSGKDWDHYFRAKRILEERERVNSVMDRLARGMTPQPSATSTQ